jgi:CRP-like cAMP-binding protein
VTTNNSDAVIDRIRQLEGERAGARINSDRHHQLTRAIHVEASLYRQLVDAEQAAAQFDPHPAPVRPSQTPLIRPASQPLLAARPNNLLLASLPAHEFNRLRPHLKTVPIHAQQVLHLKGKALEAVYFPNGGVASITTLMLDGRLIEVATVGDEGMVGIEAFLGEDAVALGDTMIQVPGGSAEMMGVADFRRHAAAHGAFGGLVGRYAQVVIAQMMQSTACNALHQVHQRCARWLLTTHDRMHGKDFHLSHEFLAVMLGVARPTVSLVAGTLQDGGLIRYTRGRITVLDRAGLLAASCECYAIVREQFDRLIA